MSVEIHQLKKQYVSPDGGIVPVIDVPEFQLEDGAQVGLIGGSGTGKTTLLNLIAGILTPDSGRILFHDNAAPSAPPSPAGSATVDYRSPASGTVDVTALSEAQRDIFRGRFI